ELLIGQDLVTQVGRQVVVEPAAYLVTEGRFLGRVVEVHRSLLRGRWYQAAGWHVRRTARPTSKGPARASAPGGRPLAPLRGGELAQAFTSHRPVALPQDRAALDVGAD